MRIVDEFIAFLEAVLRSLLIEVFGMKIREIRVNAGETIDEITVRGSAERIEGVNEILEERIR